SVGGQFGRHPHRPLGKSASLELRQHHPAVLGNRPRCCPGCGTTTRPAPPPRRPRHDHLGPSGARSGCLDILGGVLVDAAVTIGVRHLGLGGKMMVGYRLAVVLAAALAGFASAVTLPAAAADGGTAAGRTPVWVATYHGPSGNSRAVAEAISPDGATLFVTGSTGESGAAGPYHWATIADNTATGGQRWLRTYQGTDVSSSSTAAPAAIAVSPDGSMVFVTGTVTN